MAGPDEHEPPGLEVTASDVLYPRCRFRVRRPLAAGTLVRIRASGVMMLVSVRVTAVRAEGGEPMPFAHRYEWVEMERRWRWYITTMTMAVVRLPEDLPAGATLEVEAEYQERTMRGERETGRPLPQQSRDRYSGLTWRLHALAVDDIDAEQGEPVAAPFEVRFVAGTPARLAAYLRHDGRLLVRHFDRAGNPTATQAGAEREAAPGKAGRIAVRDGTGRAAVSNAPPEALDGTPIFFGEFHWHTEFSGDGQRPTVDALRSARDELALDFAGPSDHLSPAGTYRASGAERTVTRTVAEQAALCRPFEEPGRFCAVPVAELSRRYGHANLYTDSWDLLLELTARFAAELAPAWARQPDRYDLASLLRLCPPGRALVVPHHSNMDSWVREGVVREDGRPAWCAMHWPLPADRGVVRLVEMVQQRGCFEAEETDERWRIWDGGLGGSVRTALARGYRVGFVGGTDNHSGWPTRMGDGYCGLTAIQAPVLAWPELFQALRARRCYATTGARIVADVTLNGAAMGSELRLEPGAERRLRVVIGGTAPLECVQVVHCGRVLADLPVAAGSEDLDADWVDDRPGRPLEDVYYYVRARQCDGECLWTSPFWIDLPAD